MAGAFVRPGAHPIAGNYGPNLQPVEPTVTGEPAYTPGRTVAMTDHTADTSEVVAKQNIPLTGGGHVTATSPAAGRTGKHLAKW